MPKLPLCNLNPFHPRKPTISLRQFQTQSAIQLDKIKSAEPKPAKSKVIFSGIQPTGTPHLGNYLGALRQWVRLQQDAEPDTKLFYCIVDLHAITVQQDREQLRQWKRETMGILLAIGLDPTRSTIFFQSDVPAHTELMWILSCSASTGYLSRMTQWKSKLSLTEESSLFEQDSKSQLKLGLFSYPVLQAADVLVHGATHVPVGADQAQHLEFARTCATSFNHLYGTELPIPETILSPAKKVMSLREPHLKMSKSHRDPKSRILLTDPANVIQDKIKVALTDSLPGLTYDPIQRPGLSNLIEIMSHLSDGESSCEEIANHYVDLSLRSFKALVADMINKNLESVRQNYEEIMSRNGNSLRSDLYQDIEYSPSLYLGKKAVPFGLDLPPFQAAFAPATIESDEAARGATRQSRWSELDRTSSGTTVHQESQPYIESVALYGAEKAQKSAAETMCIVRDAIGV